MTLLHKHCIMFHTLFIIICWEARPGISWHDNIHTNNNVWQLHKKEIVHYWVNIESYTGYFFESSIAAQHTGYFLGMLYSKEGSHYWWNIEGYNADNSIPCIFSTMLLYYHLCITKTEWMYMNRIAKTECIITFLSPTLL